MDDLFTDFFDENKSKIKEAPKGFGSQDKDEVEQTIEPEPVVEIIEEAPSAPSPTPKRHDHSIRPMRRTKPVPKRGEKAAK